MEDGVTPPPERINRWRPTLDHKDEWVRKRAGYPARYTKAEINARRAKYMKSDLTIAEESDNSLLELKRKLEKETEKKLKKNSTQSLLPSVTSTRVLRNTVFNDIQKTRSYQKVPCYLVFLILMMVSSLEHILDDQHNAYYTLESVAVSMNASSFSEVEDWGMWWSWLSKASTALDSLVPDNVHRAQVIGPGLPLGFVHLRQWRVAATTCDIDPALSASARSLLNDTLCYKTWTQDSQDRQPFGMRPFRPDSHYEYPLLGKDVAGEVTTYPRDCAYSVLLPLHSQEDIKTRIDTLRADSFIDDATYAVTVDLVGYMPSRQQFFLTQFLVELKQPGSLINNNHLKLFRSLSWEGDKDHFVFLVDLFCVVYIVWFVVLFVQDLRFHMRSAKNVMQVFSFWRAFDVAFIALWIVTIIFRFMLWNQGASIDGSFVADRAKNFGGGLDGADRAMLFFLFHMVSIYEGTILIQGWALLLAWLRLIAFIQHTERLGVVANTIASMAATFIAISVMFLILVMGLAMAGVLVYSSDFEPMSSIWKAMRLLLRFIFTQELTCKRGGPCVRTTDMERTNSTFTAFYINLTMVLGFVVFINVMVALVISNLMLVLQASRSGGQYAWSPDVLWKEMITASRRMNPPWLSKIFAPFTSRMFRRNAGQQQLQNVTKTAGPVKRSLLTVGQPVLVLLDEPGAEWEEAMVFEVVQLAGTVMVTIKAGDTKLSFEDCLKVHHPLPTAEDKWLDVNIEERFLELIAILDSQPKQCKMDRNEWLTMTKDFMPPRNALKLFELALENDKEATETEMGERFCNILSHRIDTLQQVLDDRTPKLARIPRLREKELKRFTSVLGPVTDTLLPHFTEAQHDIRVLRQGISTDFDELTTSYSQHLNRVASQQSTLGPQLDYINRHLHVE